MALFFIFVVVLVMDHVLLLMVPMGWENGLESDS